MHRNKIHHWSPIPEAPNYLAFLYFSPDLHPLCGFASVDPSSAQVDSVDYLRLPADSTCLSWHPHPSTSHGLVTVGLVNGTVYFIDAGPMVLEDHEKGPVLGSTTISSRVVNLASKNGSLACMGLHHICLLDTITMDESKSPVWRKDYGGTVLNWQDNNILIYTDPEDLKFIDVRDKYSYGYGITRSVSWDGRPAWLASSSRLAMSHHRDFSVVLASGAESYPFVEEWDLRKTSSAVKTIPCPGPTKLMEWSSNDELILVQNNSTVDSWDMKHYQQNWTKKISDPAFSKATEITDLSFSPFSPNIYSVIVDHEIVNICETQEKRLHVLSTSENPNPTELYEKDPIIPLPGHIQRVKFEELISQDPTVKQRAVNAFSEAMRKSSFALITMSPEQKKVIVEAEQLLDQFYNVENHIKQKIAIAEGGDLGYKHTEKIKEFFQLRYAHTDFLHSKEFPWPEEPKGFDNGIIELWRTLQTISYTLMQALALGLGIDEKSLDQYLDPVEMPVGAFTHSIMGCYNYYAHQKMTTTCLIHRDMGLISLIPRAVVPGLHVLDNATLKWVEVEKNCSRDEICVIGCQTLEEITNGYYPANVHRVQGTVSRRSIVFKLRAEANAVINVAGLGSPKLRNPPSGSQTVRDWMAVHLSHSDSVNFPGQSKTNYHTMILDPSKNAKN